MESNPKNNFLKELSNLFYFWFFAVVFFAVFRIIFISIFYKQISDTATFSEILKIMLTGFKFDCTAVAYFIIIPLVSLLFLSPFNKFNLIKTIRKILQYLFVILSTVICIVTINYFREYNDQFNNFMFLALYDDQKAVLETVLEDFNPVLNLIILIAVIAIGIWIFKIFENREFIYNRLLKIQFKASKVVITFITVFLFMLGIRGSVTTIPVSRKWAAVTKDVFLNKTVVNPFRSLKYAIEDFNYLNLLDGNNPYIPNEVIENLFKEDKVSDLLLKKAKGATIEKPKQIFLVVMESYDSWPLMDKYLPFNLSSNLSRIAKKGTHYTNFVPADVSTFTSFAAITANIPYCGINVGALGAIKDPYQTSMFNQFKELGYETNFYYGGFLSWQKIGQFTKYNGVDRSFSGVDANADIKSGSWGVEDEKLFDLIIKHTDTTTYSLNIILTTSYHPHYTVDVYEKGFPYNSVDDFPEEIVKHYDKGMTLKELGHLWYGDKAIGDFVAKAEDKFPNAIFSFTGDHYGRRFINHQPNLYERSSVPFIVYGKSIPSELNTTPGSHIDIMPTLIEMIAPKDFEYYSFGTSLLDKNKKYGIGHSKIITSEELYYLPKDKMVEKFNLINQESSFLGQTELMKEYNKLMALSWHYIRKGNNLKKETKEH